MSSVAVIFGGPSSEHDVSVLTGLQAARELREGAVGDPPVAVYWSKTGGWWQVDPALEAEAFLHGVPKGAAPMRLLADGGGEESGFLPAGGRFGRRRTLDIDAAVVCCHGGPGEDGTLQAALDLAGIAYTGPSVASAALGIDKLAFGALVRDAGLPALARVLLTPDTEDLPFEGDIILKPRFGGSSIGIEVVADLATAKARLGANPHFRAGAVAEPYRPDLFDLQIAVRSWPVPELSAIERPLRSPGGSEILGYGDKYVGGEGMVSAPRELPAAVPGDLEEAMRAAASRVAALSGLRGVARIDFLSDGADALYVNEVNTIPGSLARYLWVDPLLPFRQLLADLIAEARERPSHSYTAAGADGSVLRSAGSIASKLG